MRTVLGILLLILAMVVAVTAYSSAQVNNPGTMAVVNTTQSLLALDACSGTGNKDNAIYVDQGGAGELKFDFRRGLSGAGDLGFQPNSTYTWDCAFTVQNKTNETLDMWIENSGTEALPFIDVGAVADCPSGVGCVGYDYFVHDGSVTTGASVVLDPGATIPISIRFEVPAGTLGSTVQGSLNVRATAQ